MIGAEIAGAVIPTHGWRAMFLIGGVLPLIAVTMMYFVLPESPRFLAAHGGRPRDLAALLNRYRGRSEFAESDEFVLRSAAQVRGLAAIFRPEFARDSAALWLIFLTNLFSVYAFFSWTLTILTSLGLDLNAALRGFVLVQFRRRRRDRRELVADLAQRLARAACRAGSAGGSRCWPASIVK
jgi:AAHS family 4-hydroxybenzoate transporter-like MFS transporter